MKVIGLGQDYQKKNISSMQDLRNLKFKISLVIDKYNLQIIQGGWHFSFTNTPTDSKKVKSFSHGEFNNDTINLKLIEEKIIKMRIYLKRTNLKVE